MTSATLDFAVALPEWTRFVAQDGDGMWFAYEKKPACERGMYWIPPTGKTELLCCGPIPGDVASELYEVTFSRT